MGKAPPSPLKHSTNLNTSSKLQHSTSTHPIDIIPPSRDPIDNLRHNVNYLEKDNGDHATNSLGLAPGLDISSLMFPPQASSPHAQIQTQSQSQPKAKHTSKARALSLSHPIGGHSPVISPKSLRNIRRRSVGFNPVGGGSSNFMTTFPTNAKTMGTSITTSPTPPAQSNSIPSSPSTSFVGSYENSLLSGRMATPLSKPMEFICELGVIASRSSSFGPRFPSHVFLPFEAAYYRTGDGEIQSHSSPYVGTVDLESHYWNSACSFLQYNNAADELGDFMDQSDTFLNQYPILNANSNSNTNASPKAPSFPGYRIPPKGQIQIVVRNSSTNSPIKIFLVPYDLEDMPMGTKTFLRQKTYSVIPTSDGTSQRQSLRYAVHLQFCCPPSRVDSSSSLASHTKSKWNLSSSSSKKHFYLHNSIRLVFDNRSMDSDEKFRVVNESLEGVLDSLDNCSNSSSSASAPPRPAWNSPKRTERSFASYSGPGNDWLVLQSMVRDVKLSLSSSSTRSSSSLVSTRNHSTISSNNNNNNNGGNNNNNKDNTIADRRKSMPINPMQSSLDTGSNSNSPNGHHNRRLSDSWTVFDTLSQSQNDKEFEDDQNVSQSIMVDPNYSTHSSSSISTRTTAQDDDLFITTNLDNSLTSASSSQLPSPMDIDQLDLSDTYGYDHNQLIYNNRNDSSENQLHHHQQLVFALRSPTPKPVNGLQLETNTYTSNNNNNNIFCRPETPTQSNYLNHDPPSR